MIAKKTDKGNLENKKTLFMLVGFVIVLGLVYAGFELFANADEEVGFVPPDDDFIEVKDEDVVATDQTPPPPPAAPQQQQDVVLKLVDNSVVVTQDFDFSTDVFQDDAIEDIQDEEITNDEEATEEEPVMSFSEEMPEFPGGFEAINAFLQGEIQYPKVARDAGIQGTVLVEFVVEKDGRVSNAKVKVPLFADCDKEACRGVMAMPKWKPGKNMGKPVRCYFQVPVTFSM